MDDGAARELLELCAAVRDHTPLAWLCARLAASGRLNDVSAQREFAAFLVAQPDTAVQKVVREMLRDGPSAELQEVLVAAWKLCPLERLSSSCILDRALKHNFAPARDELVRATTEDVVGHLRDGALDRVLPEALVCVPGSQMPTLEAVAEEGGVDAEFRERRQSWAMRAVDVLSEAPKAVSQANAEELLSTRVYTDPGHFLIELLQNAEDAGATRWRVRFEASRVIVWHDGAPFDFRDVVGVTSIGQTTKRKSQIGFFGVGFKSVYEITERPQIYSDVFAFEIVDVSVPRWLGQRPGDLPADGTVLVLPLRDPTDPVRAPHRLFEKARKLDPCVLFTLRGIDEIDLSLGPQCEGGPRRWRLRESAPDDRGRAQISVEPDGPTLHYVVRDDTYDYDGGVREAGRPDSTPVMVGVRVDEFGIPRPLDETAPNVYSYLPTDERAGFRFFVQGHFDVPVDRERINPESSWNRWVLQKVPRQLGRIADQLTAVTERANDAACGFLDVLPLARELNQPLFRVVPVGLKSALRDVAVLPCTDGQVHRPSEVLVADPNVARLLGDASIDPAWLSRQSPGVRSYYLLAPGLPERTVEVSRSLGAAEFTFADLLDVLAVVMASDHDELPLRGARRGDLQAIRHLYDVLLENVERVEREKSRLAALGILRRLRSIPLVPCDDGSIRPAPKVQRASAVIRSVVDLGQVFLAAPLDRLLWSDDEETERYERADALLDRLGVTSFDEGRLLTDVERAPRRFTRDESRRRALVELLSDASWQLQARAAKLPLFRATDTELYAASATQSDHAGVLVRPDGAIGEVLTRLYGSTRPLADDAHEASIALLRRAQTPELDVGTLIDDIVTRRASFDLVEVHRALDAVRGDLSANERQRLAQATIWPDRMETVRSLQGADRAYVAGDPIVATLFDVVPFLTDEIARLAYVSDVVEPVGPDWLVDQVAALASNHDWFDDADRLERVVEYLCARLDTMTQQSVGRLPSLPIFSAETADGLQNVMLGDWEHDPAVGAHLAEDGVEAVLRAAKIAVISSHTSRKLAPLLRIGSVRRISIDLLLATYLRLEPVPTDVAPPPLQTLPALDALHELLLAHIDRISGPALVELPMIPTQGGGVARAADVNVGRRQLSLFAPQSADYRRVAMITPSRSARDVMFTIRDHVRLRSRAPEVLSLIAGHDADTVQAHPHLSDPARRATFYDWLTEVTEDLLSDSDSRGRLTNSPLFPTTRGSLVPLSVLVVNAEVPDLGIDWTPAPEIPRALLLDLARRLGCDRPDATALLRAAAQVSSEDASRGLARLLSDLYRSDDITDKQLAEFASLPWVADGNGDMHRPDQLFVRSTAVEALVGDSPDLYAHPAVERHLGVEMSRRMGFQTADDVPLTLVARNLRRCSQAEEPVRLSLYLWLDQGVLQGWLDIRAWTQLVGELPWIFTDDEEWFHHDKVLGSRELQMFGSRRGYWTRGALECPNLCEALGIDIDVGPPHVVAFLREVAHEANLTGDRPLLESDPALPRMLHACYAFLGKRRAAAPDVPILCYERKAGSAATLRLRLPQTATLFRSDTPTLEAMFESVGTLHICAKGTADHAPDIDAFLRAVGVRRLRESYEVRVATDSGEDRTAEHKPHIQSLRAQFRALLGVLPRIQHQRGGVDDAWQYHDILSELVERCSIRAVDNLRVRFVLPGVGDVTQSVPSAYDPDTRALLVDTRHILQPQRDPTGLAIGLMPAIYDGPGEDQVTDIIVILLPLRTREAMDDYLDNRHFPVAANPRSEAERVAERLLEILDFGLGRRLTNAFEELTNADLQRWREPEMAARAIADGKVTSHGAALLLDAVGVAEPSDELVAALVAALVAPSIDQIPLSIFGNDLRERPRNAPGPNVPAPTPSAHPDRSILPGPTGADAWPTLPSPAGTTGNSSWSSAGASTPLPLTLPPERTTDTASRTLSPTPEDTGLLSAVRRFFGWDDGAPLEPAKSPGWTQENANPFDDDVAGIAPQLWVTKDRLEAVAQARPTPSALTYEPGNLPRPYRYAVRSAGAVFHHDEQHWYPIKEEHLGTLADLVATGQTVEFRGRLGPGMTQVPLPLHARIAAFGAPTEYAARRADGTMWVRLESPVETQFTVHLLDPPVLTDDVDPPDGTHPDLLAPTMPLHRLPPATQQFVSSRRSAGSQWERALAVEAFVRHNYIYDTAFMAHPSVRAAARKLGPNDNHHLVLLHAAAGGGVLGRGVCYELNVLVVELLRHVGVPAFPATGWVLDRGTVDRPDHLFAVAALPSVDGVTLMPLDAATTDEDAVVRPMAPNAGSMHTSAVGGPGGAWNPTSAMSERHDVERDRLVHRCTVLQGLLDHLYSQPAYSPDARFIRLRAADPDISVARELMALGNDLLGRDLFAALFAVAMRPSLDPAAMTPQIRELVDLGLVTIRTVPRYMISLTQQ